jgi:Rps23 Pro-64 3,4-dihydroxylase Tpa1-like proline 4-hydroxylase
LRDGGRRDCIVPQDEATAREVGICVHTPAQVVAGRILKLLTPDGQPFEVMSQDVIGIEMDPPYALLENFLSETEAERAMAHALAHESEFRDSTVAHVDANGTYTTDTKLRRSRILDKVDDVAPMIGRKLQERMGSIFQALNMPPIAFRNMELQLSVHGDGDFFNTHTDNGLPEIAHRTMSYVYYFHREPKRFTGGHLRLYRTVIEDGTHSAGALVADIDPPRNGLMVFPSYIQHEVSPISCPSSALADQRLTLNGWLVA